MNKDNLVSETKNLKPVLNKLYFYKIILEYDGIIYLAICIDKLNNYYFYLDGWFIKTDSKTNKTITLYKIIIIPIENINLDQYEKIDRKKLIKIMKKNDIIYVLDCENQPITVKKYTYELFRYSNPEVFED